ncbi:MAG TPA: secondary thiamine-phosphate synthase enzyme YjbQ [Candidatus Omnitrophota bacterium]|nr:secondary thiamine-phosphate synthase enzyme YjbQ [Candidatus Omnitrophota bacterium]HPN55601.1 secondary thiamine-phosphate synthase enzyme YjbQ [Candidatus Omnitrophota bacterium]
MAVVTEYLHLSTGGNGDIEDITSGVQDKLAASGLRDGVVTVSAVGSTAAVTTCEYEPGLVKDIKALLDRLIPRGEYHHDQAWGDGNGHSHLRASLMGPSLSIPFSGGQLILGTWQQIIFIDWDTRSRKRQIVVQMMGE